MGFDSIGVRYFIIYVAINAFIVPVVFFFFPETAGRSLEEMDLIFARSNSIWDPVRIAKNMPKGGYLADQVEVIEKKTEKHVEDSALETGGEKKVQVN